MRLKEALLIGAMLLVLGAIGVAVAAPASGDANVVWRIGVFDRSSGEFAFGLSDHPETFLPGKSSLSDWHSEQPVEFDSAAGPLNAGPATAPRIIQFQIAGAPAEDYRLHISAMIESPSVPAVRVVINGKTGIFYLHPILDYEMGDGISAFSAPYSHADVTFVFPGRYLHMGTNTITLQAIERSDEVIQDAFLAYDAIELDKQAAYAIVQSPIVPTIFYRQRDGQLQEVLEVCIRSGEKVKQGSAELSVEGRQYRLPLEDRNDFGEQRLEFDVPAFAAHTQATLTWTINGRRRRERQVIEPARQWTIYLVPHIHLDVGFTDYQPKVAAAQARAVEEALDLIAKHPDFRFSLDGEWPLEQFLETATPSQTQRVVQAIQKNQLFVPAQYANIVTGFPTAETLIRSLYPSFRFSQEHHTPFNYANITDVPTYSWSYASILASSGITKFLAASDNYRGPVLMQGHLNQKSPFWWQGPDGNKVLFWESRGYGQIKVTFGKPSQLAAGRDILPVILQQYDRPTYRANATILFGTQGENSDLYPQQADLADRWNRVYAYPKLEYSGIAAAMDKITRQFGDEIPIVRGDGGPYWEDGVASDAFYAALERENESRGLSAEKLATLATFINPRLAVNKPDLDRMWKDMVLMDEHTWTSRRSVKDPTSDEPLQQLAFKNQFAINAHMLVDSMAQNAMARIADSMSGGIGTLIVFNTLNWTRNGLVSIDLNNGLEIVDPTTGGAVPFEAVRSGHTFRRVNFVATGVPAFGYKRFELRRDQTPPSVATVTPAADGVMETSFYRVTLDPQTGAVRSIYDKQLKRELVDQQSPYRFGQYLYVSGGDHAPNSLLQYRLVSPKPHLKLDPSHDGRLLSVTRTPYGWVARMESTDTNTPAIATEIRLFANEKKIEFIEDFNKKEVDSKEAVYFVFPFAMKQPQFQYEIQTGSVNPAKDMYPGAGHEWFSVQHWVSVQQDGVSATVMPLDASLVTLGDINRGAWPAEFGKRNGTIFSYIMNNYWNTNYRAGQGGSFRFRYVITSSASSDAAQLSRMGWEEMTPLETDEVILQDRSTPRPRPLTSDQASFLKIEGGEVLLDTWKPAEDGNGTVLRFLDLGGTSRRISVQAPLLNLSRAWLTDSVERDRQPLPLDGSNGFHFTIQPHEIVTVRLIGNSVVEPPAL